jgi:DNA-binding winged helix-turn-helix (wHTH) protein
MIRPSMSASFRFGGFELDPAAYTLRRTGQRIRLEKIPMEVLVLLVRRPGLLVTRAEIQAALWGTDVFVEHDSGINTAVRKIRRALGDDAEHPRFLETVVGKGYRFIASLEPEGADRSLEGSDVDPRAESSGRLRRHRPNYLLTRGNREIALEKGENLLGRDPEAQVCLDHPSVSRHHARISIDSTSAVLEDLKSRNGTFLDGRRIETPAEIHHGAIIGLGPIALTLVVVQAGASTRPMVDSSAPPRKPKS